MTCKVSSDLDSIYIYECEPCGVVDGAWHLEAYQGSHPDCAAYWICKL